MGATGPLFYLQKTGDVTNTGTSTYTMNLSAQMLVTLDLSIHILHTSIHNS
jgi:hypothetical protein